ncbi:MAG TPA: MlaD family protein [Bacteroidia bacterium]|nr:MlaD family protein [Bacteroidia bacterium]
MEKTVTRNIRLGLFVLLGTAFLIYALYMIGSKRNLFGSTFRINAIFHNVNGLMAGNNVRYAGIDVGTVEVVNILNDSCIKVVMVIEKNTQKYIRKDAVASIGTDGLMGNKIVSIDAGSQNAPMIKENDTIQSVKPIETDEMLRTLNKTNDNIARITENLKEMTNRINSRNTLWSLLMDTVMADNVKEAIVNIKVTGKNSAEITGDLSNIIKATREGKGSIGALLTDTSLSGQVRQSIVSIRLTSERAAIVTGDLDRILGKMDTGKGTVGQLLMDTTFVPNLNKSMENIRKGSQGIDELIPALKHSFLLRHYFKKQEKMRKDSLL